MTDPPVESVWDYPRPPRVEPAIRRVRVELAGALVADSGRALRVLETSHPPTYYVPVADVVPGALVTARGDSYCEWKGVAAYYDVVAGGVSAERAAWGYPDPRPPYAELADCVAFYPSSLDCWLDDERVSPQVGGFYGGWVTSDVIGPFKGASGTSGW